MTTQNTHAAPDLAASTKHTHHTPGPWRVAEEHKGDVCVYGRSCDPFDDRPMTDRDTYLCAVKKGRWTYEQAANARLIAAAPELLAQCQADAHWIENLLCDINAGRPLRPAAISDGLTPRLASLRAALAKAKGGA